MTFSVHFSETTFEVTISSSNWVYDDAEGLFHKTIDLLRIENREIEARVNWLTFKLTNRRAPQFPDSPQHISFYEIVPRRA